MRAPEIHAGPVWGPRLQTALVFGGSALLAVFAGAEVAEGGPERVTTPLLGLAALAGAILLFSIPPEKLFLGWLFLAPLLQNSADETTVGRPLTLALYLAPAVVLACHTVVSWRSARSLQAVDALPALYALYVFGSLAAATTLLQSDPFGSAKAYFGVTVVGIMLYYFVAFGPGSRVRSETIALIVLLAATLQSAFSVVEWRTGWNLWGDTAWHNVGLARSVGTLVNPAVLGMFIGVGIVMALAVIVWDGPRTLRKASWFMLACGVPGLLVTLTRAPVLATVMTATALLLLGRRSRAVALAAAAVVGLALVFLFPILTQSRIYSERVANRGTVEVRAEIQNVSLRLASERPLTGWGYGKYDEVKAAVGREIGASPGVLENTSHNGFLTVLVEYGALGLAFLILPWVVVVVRGQALVRHSSPERWFTVGCIGAVLVFVLAAQAGDFRYFSFAQAVPWLFVGLVRRALAEAGETST